MVEGFKLEGVAGVLAVLDRLAKSTPGAIGGGLFREAQRVATASRHLTPVDTGALRASHDVDRPEYSGRDVSVRISVGGPAAKYALFVHENLQARHPVGQAKFLETALSEATPGMARRIADDIERGIG